MNLDHYQYFNSNDYQDYEFYSVGPKGQILKIVSFSRIGYREPPVYNLAFGDLNSTTGKLDDTVVSDNQDINVVLATVANTILEFCNRYENNYVYAKGSTPSRTRLYQMGVARLWLEISSEFEVYGLTVEGWKSFEPQTVNYEAFLVRRK